MSRIKVRLEWLTGVNRPIFQNVRLVGSWDDSGYYSGLWSSMTMTAFTAPDGCPGWWAEVLLDDSQLGWTFHWGVVVDAPQRVDAWGITTEVPDPHSTAQHRDFVLHGNGQVERYWLSHSRRLGANKVWHNGADTPAIHFAVWAPNARAVDLVTGHRGSGYIWSNERGIQRSFALTRDADESAIWTTDPADPGFADFSAWDHRPYMYRITKDDGTVAFRTDLYSRCQIGAGRKDPENPRPGEPAWNGTPQDLDGVKGCSVVIDAETVTERIDDTSFPPKKMVPEAVFWANEFDALRPVPNHLDELIIYEMHVGGLGLDNRDGAGNPLPGSFKDAIALLDHLVELGVNAVELMPATEAEGWTWGYGSSHYFATEYSSGGRDMFKHFVRACHQRGIVVLMDVAYNHFSFDAERAESLYDSNTHAKNIYYWYQGRDSDWSHPSGGYLQNGSSGRAPDYRSELVRKMFVSSAVMLMTEFHVDGFRVDLTQAFHRDNVIEANGAPVPDANRLGTKLLREWVRTLRLVKPSVILTAEDHTGWSAVTQPQETGGIGFDAIWWAEWYHHIIGDSQNDSHNARLLYVSGFGGNDPLAMSYVAGAPQATPGRVIYHESHDQAGNASYKVGDFEVHSARTIQTAVNWNLNGTRFWAEARCRVVSGLTLLAPGIPMFFMGEEVGAQEPYRYTDWLYHREDFERLRETTGARLFRFYRDVIRLRRRYAALSSPHVEILHVHDANRVLVFRRWLADADFLVFISLNNGAFADGYWVGHPALHDGGFIEVLNSDADIYGGLGITNPGMHFASGHAVNARLPANGVVVFQRV
jgi:1,4-alpha-glucan branching enzyme